MGNLVAKVKFAVSRTIFPGDKVLAAVSGGADSICLLYLLNDLKEEIGFELSIAHLNHMARGMESDEDARFVVRVGERLGLETYVEKVDIKALRKKMKTSFQEAAREARYRFFEDVLIQKGKNKIALGHTADDQAETVLINLLRGSGMKGLSGIPERRGPFIRPLIDCFRDDVMKFLRERGIECRSDSSNSNKYYLRNKVRLDLLPTLETYNKNIKTLLCETAKILIDDDRFLDDHIKKLFPELATLAKNGMGYSFDVSAFRGQRAGVQRRLVRETIRLLKGDLRKVSFRNVQDILSLASSEPMSEKTLHLPGGITVGKKMDSVFFSRNPIQKAGITSKREFLPEVIPLNVPGMTRIQKAGIQLQTQLLPAGEWSRSKGNSNCGYFDLNKTGRNVQVRFFKHGDRFIPLGMKGHKKLKSYFIDEKIPKELRLSIPILTTGEDDIIWVYGQRISDTYKITGNTREILYIEGV